MKQTQSYKLLAYYTQTTKSFITVNHIFTPLEARSVTCFTAYRRLNSIYNRIARLRKHVLLQTLKLTAPATYVFY